MKSKLETYLESKSREELLNMVLETVEKLYDLEELEYKDSKTDFKVCWKDFDEVGSLNLFTK